MKQFFLWLCAYRDVQIEQRHVPYHSTKPASLHVPIDIQHLSHPYPPHSGPALRVREAPSFSTFANCRQRRQIPNRHPHRRFLCVHPTRPVPHSMPNARPLSRAVASRPTNHVPLPEYPMSYDWHKLSRLSPLRLHPTWYLPTDNRYAVAESPQCKSTSDFQPGNNRKKQPDAPLCDKRLLRRFAPYPSYPLYAPHPNARPFPYLSLPRPATYPARSPRCAPSKSTPGSPPAGKAPPSCHRASALSRRRDAPFGHRSLSRYKKRAYK